MLNPDQLTHPHSQRVCSSWLGSLHWPSLSLRDSSQEGQAGTAITPYPMSETFLPEVNLARETPAHRLAVETLLPSVSLASV